MGFTRRVVYRRPYFSNPLHEYQYSLVSESESPTRPYTAARVPFTAPGRLIVLTFTFVLLSGAGTYAIYSQLAAHNIELNGRLLDGRLLSSAGMLLLVYFASDGLRLYYTLRALGHRLPLAQILKLVFINIFFSNVTPMATGGGFAQIWYLRRKGVPLGTATAATTVRTLLAVAVIFTAAPIALYTTDIFSDRMVLATIAPYLAAFGLLYLGFFAVVLFRTRWLIIPLDALLSCARRLHWLGGQRYRRWRFAARRESLRLSRGFRSYLRGTPYLVGMSIVCTLVFLLSLFSFPALLLWGLGYAADYADTLVRLVVTTFVMYFSPTPGASGLAEGVFGEMFQNLVAPGDLVVLTFAWRLLTVYLGMAVGVVVTQIELAGSRRAGIPG